LETVFQGLVPSSKEEGKTIYSVKIAYTWTCEILSREKRLMWLLQRGKTTPIEFEKL
jgi:hypothetical protein